GCSARWFRAGDMGWGAGSRAGGKPHPLLGGDAILTPSLAATAVQASRYRNESRTHHINAKVERRRTCFPKSMTSTSLYHIPSSPWRRAGYEGSYERASSR